MSRDAPAPSGAQMCVKGTEVSGLALHTWMAMGCGLALLWVWAGAEPSAHVLLDGSAAPGAVLVTRALLHWGVHWEQGKPIRSA